MNKQAHNGYKPQFKFYTEHGVNFKQRVIYSMQMMLICISSNVTLTIYQYTRKMSSTYFTYYFLG